jgi:signal transduction histidine kinase/DNA-binding NarL/FixJ family response regulator/streptogramin lyase
LDGHSFERFNAANIEGLVGNRILALHQASDGTLWIGTETGLSTWRDGRFRLVHQRFRIAEIEEGPGGTVWVVGSGPLQLYPPDSTGVREETLTDSAESPRFGAVEPVGQDSAWVVAGGDLYLYDEGSFRGHSPVNETEGSVGSVIEQGPDGRIWTSENRSSRHQKTLVSIRGRSVQRYSAGARFLRSMDFGPSGNPWITSLNAGLLRLKDGEVQQVQHDALPNAIFEIVRDDSGQWWIGTRGQGLIRLRPRLFQPVSTELPERRAARAMYATGDGAVWGALAQEGMMRLSGGARVHWTISDGLPHRNVWSIGQTEGGTLVAGTGNGVVWRREGRWVRALPDRDRTTAITALHRDSTGALWIGGNGTGLYRHRAGRVELVLPADSLSSSWILALHRDSEGTLWIGTRSEGVARLQDGQLTWYDTDDGVPYQSVRDVYETAGGTIWISTYGGGIARFEGDAFAPVTPEDGLPAGTINALHEAPQGVFWMTSNEGVFRAPLQQLNAVAEGRRGRIYPQVFGPADGMPAAECNGPFEPALAEDASGRLWIPTMKGPTVVDPHQDRFSVPGSLPVRIRAVRADGTSRPLDSLRLSPSTYRVAIDFTAVSLRHGEDLSFRYRLDGGQWRAARSRRTAEYTGLGAGTHRFEVQATLDGSTWYELESPLTITVAPHFYQTWWFYGLVVISVVGLGAAAYRWRTYQLRRRQQVLEKTVEARTSKLRERTEALAEAKEKTERQAERLAELDEAKNRFFANVSHELRTPLTTILGPLEDALEGRYGDLPGRFQDRLDAMKRQAERLRALVGDLLRLSKLEEGQMELAARPIDLEPFLERMASLFDSMAERQGATVHVETEGSPSACADPEALKQIVSNLLSNALEHTPEGGAVRLRAETAESHPGEDGGAEGERAVISVRDAGPGLPEEVQGRLFERYVGTQAGEEGTPGVSTGIGLAVVKELAERHGGAVEAKSEEGVGTEITVSLPSGPEALPEEDLAAEETADGRAVPEPSVEAGRHASRPTEEGAGPWAGAEGKSTSDEREEAPEGRPTVLVVDDEAEVRSYLKEVLAPRYAAETAADGEEGLEKARETRPDLVISDVVMPRRDGYELCRALRADERLRALPIILLTVQDEQEDRMAGLREGADAYLTKPFRPEELRQRVENLIGIRRYLQSRGGEEPAPHEPAPHQDRPPEDGEGKARARVGTESEVLRAVRAAVEAHLGSSAFGVERLADEVGLSTRQLQRRLQEETGLTAAAFIRALRMERAAELLEGGAATTVKEAAEAVGYRNPSYFSRLFKEAHGASPSELKAKS